MPNILVFTPTWETAPGVYAIHPACEESINALREGWPVQLDWRIGTDNPYPVGDLRNVLHQYQRARELFLSDGNYDAMLTVEHDNVLPDGAAAARMYHTDADVVYAPYQLRHKAYCLNTWQYIGDHALGMSLTNYPDELAAYRAEGTGRICGCGFGATLFRRHVLEAIDFRAGDGANVAPDLPFAADALRHGFVSMGRFDVPVAHMDGSKRLEAYGEIDMVKVLATQTVNAYAAGELMRLEAGQVYVVLPHAADELVCVGFATIVPDEQQPETAMLAGGEQAVMPKPKSKRVR